MDASFEICSRSSSREVRIKVPFFSVVYFSRRKPAPQKRVKVGTILGDLGGIPLLKEAYGLLFPGWTSHGSSKLSQMARPKRRWQDQIVPGNTQDETKNSRAELLFDTCEAHVCKKTNAFEQKAPKWWSLFGNRSLFANGQRRLCLWKSSLAHLRFRTFPPISACFRLCSGFLRPFLALQDALWETKLHKSRSLEKCRFMKKTVSFSKRAKQKTHKRLHRVWKREPPVHLPRMKTP